LTDAAVIEALSHLFYSLGFLVTALLSAATWTATLKNRKVGKENAEAVVRAAEQNTAAIQETLHNGIGQKIADKVVESTVPVLQEHAQTAALKIEAAAEVAERKLKTAGWDGVERRVGPEDRRG
jgi:hypothetical protein